MRHKPDIDIGAVERLVEVNDLNGALNMLKDWAGYTRINVRKEVIVLKGRLAAIKQQERMDFVNFEDALRLQSKIAHAILSILDAVNTTQ